MNNQEYWEMRKARQMYEHMDKAEDEARNLQKVYISATNQVIKQAEKVFMKYQSKYGLSISEAEKLLSKVKNPDDIRKVISKLKLNPDNEGFLKELESQSYGYRISHLSKTLKGITTTVMLLANEKEKRTRQILEQLTHEAYNKTMFNMQQYSGYGFQFSSLSPKIIKKILKHKWHGGDFSSRIWDNADELANIVKHEILVNMLTGRPLRDASKSIEERVAKGYGKARRLIRTESSYVCNQIQAEAYKNVGAKKYIYVAILDLKTSKICQELDKTRHNVNDAQVGVNFPPMHPWCRSTTIANMPNSLLAKLKQSAIDPITGKRITVPGNMTYKEWHKAFVEGNTMAEAKEKALKNKNLDAMQYEKYKAILGTEAPNNLESFQDLKYNNKNEWENLKENKQDIINNIPMSKIGRLNGKLGNKEVRLWYKNKDGQIPEKVKHIQNLETRAKEAHRLRNEYRTQARDLMKDQEARKMLDIKKPNKTWDELLEHKYKRYVLKGNDAYNDIIKSSTKTNKRYDKISGVEL